MSQVFSQAEVVVFKKWNYFLSDAVVWNVNFNRKIRTGVRRSMQLERTHKSRTTDGKAPMLLAIILGLGAASPVPTVVAESVDEATGQEHVIDRIAAEYQEFAGDSSQPLVEALRNGEDLSYEIEVEQPVVDADGNPVYVPLLDEATGEPLTDADGNPLYVQATDESGALLFNEDGSPKYVQETETVVETIVVANRNGSMGYGEVDHAMSLARALLGDEATFEEIVKVLYNDDATGILDMRADGYGWGEIFQAYDLKLGQVKQQYKPKRIADAEIEEVDKHSLENANKPEKPSRPEKPAKMAKLDKPEKPEKPEKPVKPEKLQKPEKPDRPGRS